MTRLTWKSRNLYFLPSLPREMASTFVNTGRVRRCRYQLASAVAG